MYVRIFTFVWLTELSSSFKLQTVQSVWEWINKTYRILVGPKQMYGMLNEHNLT